MGAASGEYGETLNIVRVVAALEGRDIDAGFVSSAKSGMNQRRLGHACATGSRTFRITKLARHGFVLDAEVIVVQLIWKLPQFGFHSFALRAEATEQNRPVERHPRGTVVARGIAIVARNQARTGGAVDSFVAEIQATLLVKKRSRSAQVQRFAASVSR